MKNYREYLEEELKDPEFKREWEALEPEFRRISEELSAERIHQVAVEEEPAKDYEVGYAV